MNVNLPNLITAARIAATPVVAILLFRPDSLSRLAAFAVFLAAALSDLWDGYLARRRGQTSDFGKMADPIADKLLLAATLVPFYVLTTRHPELAGLPVVDVVPLWAVVVLLGRELVVTGLRLAAARRGLIVPAWPSGKKKTLSQNFFVGGTALWIALQTSAAEQGWTGTAWSVWQAVNGWFAVITLALALVLTVYSLVVYVRGFRRVLTAGESQAG